MKISIVRNDKVMVSRQSHLSDSNESMYETASIVEQEIAGHLADTVRFEFRLKDMPKNSSGQLWAARVRNMALQIMMSSIVPVLALLILSSAVMAQEVDIIYRTNVWTYDALGRGTATDISAEVQAVITWEFTKAGYAPPNRINNYTEGRLFAIPLIIFEFDVYNDNRVVYWVRASVGRNTMPQQYFIRSLPGRGYGYAANASERVDYIGKAATEMLEYLGVYPDSRFAVIGGLYHREGRVQVRFPLGYTIEWINSIGEVIETSERINVSASTVYLRKGVYFVFATNNETEERYGYTVIVGM